MIDLTLHEGITVEQMAALHKLHSRHLYDYEGSTISFGEFASKAERYGNYIGISWCGMFVGIEKDGYTHT